MKIARNDNEFFIKSSETTKQRSEADPQGERN